ncbi:hypothetical protein CEXT_221571 [Caerostris extrusa]|uniref:Uncharacterized protein n=1 Tax=Caerostris extrusa TaxID=172846 RepID=A0AAV4PG87_CAEEX|nr:hypothetical protein CEXT_221571 [Caerostris extrusa]
MADLNASVLFARTPNMFIYELVKDKNKNRKKDVGGSQKYHQRDPNNPSRLMIDLIYDINILNETKIVPKFVSAIKHALHSVENLIYSNKVQA